MENILFMGGCNMTRAMVTGLVKTGYPSANIIVIDRHADKRAYFSEILKTEVGASIDPSVHDIAILILAIKPQGAESFCRALTTNVPLIISVLAGVTLTTLQTWLGQPRALVRAMPNTPALIQAGATGLFANALVSMSQKSQVEQLMQAIGIYAWVAEERLIDVITALSGSGPAYYFYLLELMQQTAMKMGLPSKIARDFSLQTAYGAAKLALDSGVDVNELRASVTSKKGATEAAIQCMKAKGLVELVEESLHACRARAEALSSG